jgi:hypothetical protein
VIAARPRPRLVAAWIFLFLSAIYLATFGGHLYTGDGAEMCKTAESLILHGDLALTPGVDGRLGGYAGTDGRHYSPYALGLSVIEAPLFGAGRLAATLLHLSEDSRRVLAQAAAISVNVLVTAATAALLFLLLAGIGCANRAAVTTSLLYGLGTMAWVYSKHDFAEPLAALALLGSVHGLARFSRDGGPRSLLMAGAFNGLGFFTKYQMVIFTPVLLVFALRWARRRGEAWSDLLPRSLWFLLPGLPFGLVNLWVNHARFGTWLETGYANQGEIFAGWGFLPAGLFGLLLSPGKGLLWYSPILIAAPFAWREFHRRHAELSALCAALAAVTLLMFAPLWWWHGDWSWGPRYMVILLPIAAIPLSAWVGDAERMASRVAGGVRLRHLLAGLMVLAIAVNFLGLSVHFVYYLIELRQMDKVHDDWNFIPNLSPIRFHAHVVGAWILEAAGLPAPDFTYTTWCDGVLRERVIPMATYAAAGREPDYFFFRPRPSRAARAALALAGLSILGVAVVAGGRLRSLLAVTEG